MRNSSVLGLLCTVVLQLVSGSSFSVTDSSGIVPSAPKGLAAVAGNGQVTLTWNKNTEPDFLKYLVYTGNDSTSLSLKDSTSASVNDTTKTIPGLANGTEYYFRVSALDSARLESEKSDAASATPVSPLSIISFTPTQNALNVDSRTSIAVTFSSDINLSTLTDNTVKVNGSLSGPRSYALVYDPTTRTAIIIMNAAFWPGEIVTTIVTRGVRNTAGDSLSRACVWEFIVKSAVASGDYLLSTSIAMSHLGIPSSIIAADLDGDKDIDLVTTLGGSNRVLVFKNDGHVNYTLGSYINLKSDPRSMAAGDFDADGDIDLAVVNGMDTVSILKNNGNGAYTIDSVLSTGMLSWSVAAGDFDGDGDIDLAATDLDLIGGSIFLNNGNATFTKGSTQIAGDIQSSITTGDFDGDVDIDLAVTNTGGSKISILKNDGSGNYTLGSTPSAGIGQAVAKGDIDGDGDLDLAVVNSSGSASILKNDGDGNFVQSSTPSTGRVPRSVTAGDIDGDGDIDLAIANDASNLISIMKNNGSGSFMLSSTLTVGTGPKSIATGDFDGDGDIDLAVACDYSDEVSILLNQSIIPAAPKNLVAAAGNGQVILKWRKNTETDFLKYLVYMGNDSTTLTLQDSTISSRSDTTKTIIGLTNETKYYFRISALDKTRLESEKSNAVSVVPSATDVPAQNNELPDHYRLGQNYPNPFNPSTKISLSLPSRSYVSLRIFDVLGREAAVLADEVLPAGNYTRQWNATGMPSGIYFYRLQSGPFSETKKLILLR